METGNSRYRCTMACLSVCRVGGQENRKNYDTVTYIGTGQSLNT
jgi:hypothetical protein